MADAQPTLAELLSDECDLASFTDEDLETRRQSLSDAARTAREGDLTDEIKSLIAAGVEQVRSIATEQDERAEAAAALVAEVDASMAMLDEIEAGPETEEEAAADESDGETAETETEEVAATDETPAAEVETTEVSAAAAPKKPLKRGVRVPARHQSAPRSLQPTGPRMIAMGDSIGVTSGGQFVDRDDMNRSLYEKWLSLGKSGGGERHMMARLDYRHMFSEEQTLTGGAPDEVTDKVMRYIEARREDIRQGGDGTAATNRLRVASGGVPGPAEPRYSQIVFGDTDRPIRDALPTFQASRGSVVYNGSPTLADIVLDTGAGAIGTVTSAQDLSGATKNVQEISAPTATTVTVEAETLRWSQGNFADRFNPERTAAFMKLGLTAFARHNEALRLTDIKTNCTKYTDSPAKFGAFRDFKAQFIGQVEGIMDLVRDFNLPLRALVPDYVPAMCAVDLLRSQPGDNNWSQNKAKMRAEIESWYPNVTITWLKDSIRGRLDTTPTGQSPRSYGFDADVEWALFPEGAFLFLDGGQLDLGIIRDSVVSATNKFQTFYEEWEAIAPLLSSTLCSWVTSSLCAGGISQIATAVSVCSPQNS